MISGTRQLYGRRIGLLLAALTAALLAAFALVLMASNNPAQAQSEFSREVPADKGLPGFPTGIFIHEGDHVDIEATGVVDLDGPDATNYDDIPPNGQANTAPAGAGFVLPSANIGALLGSIDQFSATNEGFLVGKEKSFTAEESGELYLIVNDTVFTDNTGKFTAKITVTPPPPDTKAPKVISTIPSAGASGVAPGANIKAEFSEVMIASTINGNTVKLFKKGSTTEVGASVRYNATTDRAILDPTNSLRSGVTYKAVVTTGAKDLAGNRLDQDRSVSGLQKEVWSFKVED